MFFGKRRKKKNEGKPLDETYVGDDFGFDEDLESRDIAPPRRPDERDDSLTFDPDPPREEPPRRRSRSSSRRPSRSGPEPPSAGRSLEDDTFVETPGRSDSPPLVPRGGSQAAPPPPADEDRPDMTVFIGAPADVRSTAVAWLVAASGEARGRDYRLKDSVTRVGAAPESDIRLTGDEYASTRHAEVRFERGEHQLVDLESTNGTFVNDERVRGATLADGDRIRFGLSEFVFKCARL